MTEVEQFEHAGVNVALYYDDDRPESPRDWAHVGHMVCWHRRADLGDETIDTTGFESMDELVQSFGARVVLPLYLYEHGGMTMSVGAFGDPWDSGQVGFIYATDERARSEFGEAVTDEQIRAALKCEVEEYDQWLRGDVYGYVITDSVGDDLDSCWGFYGLDYALEEARRAAEYAAKQVERERVEAAHWAARDTMTQGEPNR